MNRNITNENSLIANPITCQTINPEYNNQFFDLPFGVTISPTGVLSAPGLDVTVEYVSTGPITTPSLNVTGLATLNQVIANNILTSSLSVGSLGLIPNQSTSQSINIPNVSSGDYLVTNNTTATLINKSISGTTNTFTNIPTSALADTVGSGQVVLGTSPTITTPIIYGNVTNPTSSVFRVHLLNNVTNITGNSVEYAILFDTLDYDKGSNITLNSSGKTIFTAPKSGYYFFAANILIGNVNSSNIGGELYINKNTATGELTMDAFNPYYLYYGVGVMYKGSIVRFLGTGDYVSISVLIRGSSSANVGIQGSSDTRTCFQGWFLC